ncbi:hypothetical protein COT98_03050 [Candidatus Falkowbacteria bacterium CG10_big_fil_rev_8_21_14_0_10_39_9]|uniref:Uncharacterized protein n=1 Tax=Candidatus Falkowbacteria bacterium CG10_big_fil_rev_8_21_14_0_10_39_9 TaxID=1974566 RepID=A0A2M6WP07_9BACT|nr:MAG: hypothetical protein COT98_03050 [Candidatus Falkowbacteria bacterium CG10_big_fil_rev_8_21_14_0_10_39_9]
MPIKYSQNYNSRKPVKRRIVINKRRPLANTRSKAKSLWARFFNNHKIVKSLILLGVLGILSFSLLVFFLSRNLPNPNQLIQREVAQSTTIYDRAGENILYEIHGDQKRTLISLNEIPNNTKNATIAIEDKNFYKHGGISIWAMIRTVITNVLYNKSAGGSTLTQQFVKNAILSNEKTVTRKIKEIILAQRIEKKFSKDEILQMYLNEIPYGSNAYGIEAASQKYFGKSVKDTNLSEAAILAALPQSPSRYSPYGAHKDLLIARQQYILDIMQEQGYISEAERDDAKKFALKFAGPETNITAPHFIMYIKEILAEKYGEKTIEQDGLKIYTTLDLYKQKIAEEVVKAKSEGYPEKYKATNAALVSLDPKTGQVLAMVGSRDYFNEDIDGQVNITTSLRQPGSSIKPLVYATLFNKGYTPNTILYDVVTNFAARGKAYEPHNYNGKEYGPVSIRQALAGSLNVPAVKAIYLAGIKNVITLAQDMGYTSLTNPDRYGLSLVLGGGEIKMVEHVNAFSTFAREGEISPISVILKVEDKDGKVLEEYKDKKKTVLSSQVAREITSVLTDNAARTFIFGAKNYLTLADRPIAAKTGTTNDYKDAWTIGYTPSLVTGVWVGNNDSSEMSKGADGSVVAAPIWNEFMKRVLTGTPVEQFRPMDDAKTGKAIIDGDTNIGRKIKINKETGLLATSSTPPELIEEKTFSEPHCILYYVDKNDPLGPVPSNPVSDPQFNLWESRIIEWAKKNGLYSTSTNINITNPQNSPVFEITSPKDKEIITSDTLNASINIISIADNANIEYYINNNLLFKTTSYPFNLSKKLDFLNNGYHNLKVRVCDSFYNCSEKSLEFNLLLNNNYQNPPSLNLTSPSSGLATNHNDFPISVGFSSPNPNKIARIELYYLNSKNEKQLIRTIDNVDSQNIITTWDNPPSAGDYRLYAEFYDWSGNMKKTNKATVVIN